MGLCKYKKQQNRQMQTVLYKILQKNIKNRWEIRVIKCQVDKSREYVLQDVWLEIQSFYFLTKQQVHWIRIVNNKCKRQ